MERLLQPEILDSLAGSDPRAVRSRRDLGVINAVMGNHTWIRNALAHIPQAATGPVVELGAGDGSLLQRINRRFPKLDLIGCDLIPRPDSLPERVQWSSGNFLQAMPGLSGSALIGNLIVHHLNDAEIGRIGEACDRFHLLAFSEPHRTTRARFWGALASPIVNDVTRHDLHCSIDAGFRPGELPELLGLDPAVWKWTETTTLFGACRLLAIRS